MNGFLILNKEKNMTSHLACKKVGKLLGCSKVGHTGTLDPDSEGVLVIALGGATKAIPLLENSEKHYLAEALFGYNTTTGDISGEIIEKGAVSAINTHLLDEMILKLATTTKQKPPIYSAIKIQGKKLYEYARSKKEVDIPDRDIAIKLLKRKSDIKYIGDIALFDLEIIAAQGIYIRSLIEDLGKMMNIPATMSKLTRLKSGDFSLNNSYTLADIEANNYQIITLEDAFFHYDRYDCNSFIAKLVLNGAVLDSRHSSSLNHLRIYYEDKLIALYNRVGNEYYPKVIVRD